jgi:hypothetical protein
VLPAAKPMAVLNTPSIPLAPRFEATLVVSPKNSSDNLQSASPVEYISTSRIGILLPRNKVEPGRIDVATARATNGSVTDSPMVSFALISMPTWTCRKRRLNVDVLTTNILSYNMCILLLSNPNTHIIYIPFLKAFATVVESCDHEEPLVRSS